MTAITQGSIDLPNLPAGWTTPSDIQAFADLVTDNLSQADNVAIIGVLFGRVAIGLSQATSGEINIECIDNLGIFDGSQQDKDNITTTTVAHDFSQSVATQLAANVSTYSNISVTQGWFPSVTFSTTPNLVFVDCGIANSVEIVSTILEGVKANVAAGTILGGYHYCTDYSPNVITAVEVFASTYGYTVNIVPNTTIWYLTI